MDPEERKRLFDAANSRLKGATKRLESGKNAEDEVAEAGVRFDRHDLNGHKERRRRG